MIYFHSNWKNSSLEYSFVDGPCHIAHSRERVNFKLCDCYGVFAHCSTFFHLLLFIVHSTHRHRKSQMCTIQWIQCEKHVSINSTHSDIGTAAMSITGRSLTNWTGIFFSFYNKFRSFDDIFKIIFIIYSLDQLKSKPIETLESPIGKALIKCLFPTICSVDNLTIQLTADQNMKCSWKFLEFIFMMKQISNQIFYYNENGPQSKDTQTWTWTHQNTSHTMNKRKKNGTKPVTIDRSNE